MYKLASLAVLALAAMTAHAGTPSEALTAFHAALTAGDQARALALLSPNVLIYESGSIERSRSEYASHHLAGDMEFSKGTSRKVIRYTERTDGNMATVLTETATTGSYKDKEVNMLGLETALLEKKGDDWVIVHVHWSSRKAK